MSSPRLKVLQLMVTLSVGGAEELVAAFVKGLNPERFSVQAATIGPPGPIGEELTRAGYPVISLGLDIKHTSTLKVALTVRRLLKELKPDILHTHLYHPNLFGRLAAWGLGLPGVVAEVHNSYTAVKLHRRLWNRLLSRVSHCVVAVSPQVMEDVGRYDRVPPGKLRLLPNGIDLAALNVPCSREEAKDRLGVTGFCIGAVGRLEEQKGHTYLLDAAHRLQGEIPDLTVLLAAEGRQEAALKQQARDLGIQEMVRFLGTRRDMPWIFRAMDLYVQPSLWEGLSLALLQAMGAGLPVAASRVSGSQEVIEEGVNGLLVTPADAPALAASILDLYHQPQTRELLGDAARRTVEQKYSQDLMLRRLEGLYLELWEQSKTA